MRITAGAIAFIWLIVLFMRRDDARLTIFIAALCGSMIGFMATLAEPFFSAVAKGISSFIGSFT